MKYSKQRERILDTILSSRIHPTADDVYVHLRPHHPSLSLGTVYRNLNQLAECGKIRKLAMPWGSDRFDSRLEEHDHMVCEQCGGVFDVDCNRLEQLDQQIAQETGFLVTGHSLLVHGICKNCLAKRAAPACPQP